MGECWILGHKCERCGHEWPKKRDPNGPGGYKEELPTICPKCRNAYWNRPRQRPKENAVQELEPSSDNKTTAEMQVPTTLY